MRYLLVMLCLLSFAAQANPIEAFKFKDLQQEKEYQRTTEQLRCLVCQNESIASSNADLAQDMRHLVYEMVVHGKTQQQINAYMVHRYGDYVLYDPPFRLDTAVLWIGPFALFVLGIWLMLRAIRMRRAASDTTRVTAARLHEAADLLDDPSKDQDTPS